VNSRPPFTDVSVTAATCGAPDFRRFARLEPTYVSQFTLRTFEASASSSEAWYHVVAGVTVRVEAR
jgi:hypothetical protein